MSDQRTSAAQIVSVDVRKLGLGMSHAFQGMAEVCASIGVPQGDLLKATDTAADEQAKTESNSGNTRRGKGGKKNASEAAEPDAGLADPVGNDGPPGVAGDEGLRESTQSDSIRQRGSTEASQRGNAEVGEGDKVNTSSTSAAKLSPKATADDIGRILAAKVQQKKIKAADARALLDKYGAKSVSTLDPQYFDAVLEEASSM